MNSTPSNELIVEAVLQTIEGNRPTVESWMVSQPGSWGFLAGKAVIAYREILERPLTDLERREVWHLLWIYLTHLKQMAE